MGDSISAAGLKRQLDRQWLLALCVFMSCICSNIYIYNACCLISICSVLFTLYEHTLCINIHVNTSICIYIYYVLYICRLWTGYCRYSCPHREDRLVRAALQSPAACSELQAAGEAPKAFFWKSQGAGVSVEVRVGPCLSPTGMLKVTIVGVARMAMMIMMVEQQLALGLRLPLLFRLLSLGFRG